MSWLTLLLDDAAAADLDAARGAALAAAGSARERAEVEAEAAAAHRLRNQLLDHRRRLAELAALNDLGVRLTGLRDLDALLQEVVTQARRLLDADVAYLALPEPDRTLVIKVTDGSLGPHLRGVRLSPHSGLAGQVLDSGEPVSSHDYLADDALRHDAEADRIAGVEGLRTITGVPLRLHGDVIGVLMTAQRAVQPATPHDLSLLGSLAALAAVAIDNARLFEEVRRTAESVGRAVTLHEQLMDAALRGGGVVQIVRSLSEAVPGDVSFVDATDRVATTARDGQPLPDPAPLQLLDAVTPSRHFAAAGGGRAVADAGTVTVPVTAVDTYYGAVQVRGQRPLDEVSLRLLERSAVTIALLASSERAVGEAQQRTLDDVLDHLLTRPVADADALVRQARSVGLQLDRPQHVVVVAPGDGPAAVTAAEQLAAVVGHGHGGGLSGRVGGHLVALATEEPDLGALAPAGRCALGTVGVAGPATGPAALASAYKEARDCVTTLLALDRAGAVASAAELGPFRLLLSTAGRADARRYVTSTIGALLDYDERRGSDLVDTARAYLAAGQRHAETARLLNVHPNTLYQRLRRIDQVLGAGWCHESRCLDIQLALRMHPLLDPR